MEKVTVTAGQNPAATIISFIMTLVMIVASWKMYVKMGEEGWACLIPFYNEYLIYKRCWERSYYFYVLFAVITGGVTLTVFVMALFAGNTVIAVCMGMASGIIWLFAIAMKVYLEYRLSRAFGHGAAFTAGLVLMPVIFTIILGFGDDSYKVDYLNS